MNVRLPRPCALALAVLVPLAGCGEDAPVPGEDGERERVAVDDAIAKGLGFLAARQRPDGNYPIYSVWHDPTLAGEREYVDTPAAAIVVLQALAALSDREAAQALAKSTYDYVLAQREPPGVWRYFGRERPDLITPDVDDTCNGWIALHLHGAEIDPALHPYLDRNRREGGLYNTWIDMDDWVGDGSSMPGVDTTEIDPVVNAAVLYYYALQDVPQPVLCDYLNEFTTGERYATYKMYYPSPFVYAYFLSRPWAQAGATCLEPAIRHLEEMLLRSQDAAGGWGELDVESAAAVAALVNVGYRGEALDRGVADLLRRQRPDGGWAIGALYRGAGFPQYYGSEAQTTAIGLEALARYAAAR